MDAGKKSYSALESPFFGEGQDGNSLEMLLEAHGILIKNVGLDHTAVFSLFLAMGGCLHEIGDLKQARAANEEALRIFRIAVAYC
jgi:hypothetical protein